MSRASDRISKFWIYMPIYLAILGSSVWYLYDYLNRVEPPVNTQEPILILLDDEFNLSDDLYECLDVKKRSLGGTFGLIPTGKLASYRGDLDTDCFVQFCEELGNIEMGLSNTKRFYRKARGGDACYEELYQVALEYHNQKLQELPVLPLFYNSGQDLLSTSQKAKIFRFFKDNIDIPEEQGILIIGRASRVGDEERNRRLSKKRAERIIEVIDSDYIVAPDVEYVHFGSDPPQLDIRSAKDIGIRKSDYENIDFGSGSDSNGSLRLNQSVLLVIYEKDEDPFDLDY